MTDEQPHTIVRVLVTLDWFARAGCPIVVLDEMTARGFATVSPPPADAPLEWPLGAAYGFSIGEGAALVRHPVSTAHMPTEMREHFTLVGEVAEIKLWARASTSFPMPTRSRISPTTPAQRSSSVPTASRSRRDIRAVRPRANKASTRITTRITFRPSST